MIKRRRRRRRSPNKKKSTPCPLKSASIPVTTLDDLSILGVPLGPPDVVHPYIDKKILGGIRPLLDKLTAFEDSQAASFLLRVSFSSVRATHFMRTTPLNYWRGVALSFDSTIRGAFETIVPPDRCCLLASLVDSPSWWVWSSSSRSSC